MSFEVEPERRIVQSDIQWMDDGDGIRKQGCWMRLEKEASSPSARQVTRVCAFLAVERKSQCDGTQPEA